MGRGGSELTAFDETIVFLDYFEDLPDPRQAGKVIYPPPEVLLLCLFAVLAGAETFVACLIRLLPTPPTWRVLPGSGVKLCVGRCGDVARDAEQGTEGVERIVPPVEAEGEFVEVGLQVLVTDPATDAVSHVSGLRRRDG